MKRRTRRILAVALGLYLGWIFAGVAATPGAADGSSTPQTFSGGPSDAQADVHSQTADHADRGHGSPGAEHDPARDAARELVPAGHGVSWYPWVLTMVVGLFVGAIAFGLYQKNTHRIQRPDDDGGH